MIKRLASLVCSVLLTGAYVVSVVAPSAADDPLSDKFLTQGGAWHYKTYRCVDSTVTDSGYRLQGQSDSGTDVSFATTLGFEGLKGYSGGPIYAGVVTYETNRIMAKEHRGDRVQVCLVSIPLPSAYCNPDKDQRGWIFRVYDYRQHAAYVGPNSEHTCGGA